MTNHSNATGAASAAHVDVLSGSQAFDAELDCFSRRLLALDIRRTDQFCSRLERYGTLIA
jgi:hypothetical protein